MQTDRYSLKNESVQKIQISKQEDETQVSSVVLPAAGVSMLVDAAAAAYDDDDDDDEGPLVMMLMMMLLLLAHF